MLSFSPSQLPAGNAPDLEETRQPSNIEATIEKNRIVLLSSSQTQTTHNATHSAVKVFKEIQ